MVYRTDPNLARAFLLEQTYLHFDESCGEATAALRDGAKQLVPGSGVLDPKVVFIGEAPGETEDRIGRPFVGASGQFLDELIAVAGIQMNEVWVTNIVKYRPPGNRTPEPEEIAEGRALLRREMGLVRPKTPSIYVGLGRTAVRSIVARPISVAIEHGSWCTVRSGRLFVSYHPAAGLRNASIRRQMIKDFSKLGEELQNKR